MRTRKARIPVYLMTNCAHVQFRQESLLALVRPRPRRSYRTTLRLPFVLGSPYRRWFLLRDGHSRSVGRESRTSSEVVTYDPCSSPVSNTDYPALEKVSEIAIKEKQKFERLVVSKENLLKMFHVCLFYPRPPRIPDIFYSTINTSNTSLTPKSLMAPLLPFTVVAL